MKLTFEGTTSQQGTCPTLYSTDRETYVVQGDKVTDEEHGVGGAKASAMIWSGFDRGC